jgi:hypothetical protein
MSLQIRRGTEGQRGAVTFDAGEIVFTTDTHKLYVGDGSTAGGVNVLASAAGNGMSWNASTQQLDFAGTLSGFTTNNLAEGTTNKYYHQATAQADVAAMFIPYGTPTVTGLVSGVVTPNLITLSTVTGLIPLAPITFTGTGGAAYGLTAGTYWITSVNSGASQITISSTLAYAQVGTSDVSIVSTHSVAGVAFTAGQGATATPDDSNIAFTYNPTTKTILANVTLDGIGILSVSQDTNPQLGGNLNINTFTINGTGTIGIAGNISNSSGNITSSAGNIIASVGNIVATAGNITASSGSVTAASVVTNVINGSTNTIIVKSSNQSPLALNSIGAGDISSGTVPVLALNASKGTVASPTNTAAGDYLHGINFTGYYAGNYLSAASIFTNWDATATLSANHPASTLTFVTGSNNNAYNTLTFNSTGTLTTPNLSVTGLTYKAVNYVSVSSTTTYVLSTTVSHNVLVVSTTGLTATLTLPASPTDQQLCSFTVASNTVTLAMTAGPTVVPAFAGSQTSGTVFQYVYRASNSTWYRC